MLNNDVPPSNPTYPLHNECPVQTIEDQGPTHYDIHPSKIDGVNTKRNALILGVENINTLDPPTAGV